MTDPEKIAERLGQTEVVAKRLEDAGHWVSPDRRIYERAAAKLIGVKPRTMRNWRSLGIGPSYIAAGVLTYRIAAILEFLESRENR